MVSIERWGMAALLSVSFGLAAGFGLNAGAAPPAPAVTQTSPCQEQATDDRLMLIPFENKLKNQDPAIGEMAADTLQLGLLKPKQRAYRVIGRKQVKAILAELAFSESALSDPAKALKLGKILSANLMLSGTVTAGQIHTSEVTNLQPTEFTWATVQVNATLIRVETGEVLFAGKAEGSSKRYPTWQGDTYTSIIVEAVEQASESLSAELAQAGLGESLLPAPVTPSLAPSAKPQSKPPSKPGPKPSAVTKPTAKSSPKPSPKPNPKPSAKPSVIPSSRPTARPQSRMPSGTSGSKPAPVETGPRREAASAREA